MKLDLVVARFLQKLLSHLWPPYKFKLRRREHHAFVVALVDRLPAEFDFLRRQLGAARMWGIDEWPTKPDLRFVSFFYPGKTLDDLRTPGGNICISGLTIYSNKTEQFEHVELILKDNLLTGLKISNANYDFTAFDVQRIENKGVQVEPFEFEPDEIEIFYESLEPEIKRRLRLEDMFDVQPHKKTYYVFYDLEDGNYLATDKHQHVFSLVHGARPITKKMKQSLGEILIEIENGTFDKEKHLDERYSKSR